MGKRGIHFGFCLESQKETNHQEDLGVGWRIILKWMWER
jgi:hypothetical protein